MKKRIIAILMMAVLLIGSFNPLSKAQENTKQDEIYYWKVYTTDIAKGEENLIEWINPTIWDGMGYSWDKYWNLGYDTIEFRNIDGDNYVVGSDQKMLKDRKVGDVFYDIQSGHADKHERNLTAKWTPLMKNTIKSISPFSDNDRMFNVKVTSLYAYKHIGYARSYDKDIFEKYELNRYTSHHPTDYTYHYERISNEPTGDVNWINDDGFQEDYKNKHTQDPGKENPSDPGKENSNEPGETDPSNKSKIDELEKELADKDTKIADLEKQIEHLNKLIAEKDANKCPSENTEKCDELEKELEEIKKAKANLEKELEDAKKAKDDVLANAKEEAKKEIGKNKDLTDTEKVDAYKKIDDAKTVEKVKKIVDDILKNSKAKQDDPEYLKKKLEKLIDEAKRVRYPSEELEKAIDEAYDIILDRYSRADDYKYAIENLEKILQNMRDTRRNRYKLDVDELKDTDKELTGKTESKWYVDVYNGYKRILNGQANYKGDFSIEIKKDKIKAKDKLKIVATDPRDDSKYKEVEIVVGGDTKETKENKPAFSIDDLLTADGSNSLVDLAIFPVGKNYYNVIQNSQKTTVYMDVKAFISGSRTMLPIRYIAYTLGFNVEYDNISREAIFSNTENPVLAKKTISINIDTGMMRDSYGRIYQSDVKPMLINNRIHASIANIAKMFEASQGTIEDGVNQTIEWDNARKAVYVFKNVK